MEYEDLAKQIATLEANTSGRLHSIDLRLTRAEVEQAGMVKQVSEFKGDLKAIREGVLKNHEQANTAILEIQSLRQSGSWAFRVAVVIFTIGLSIIGMLVGK